MDGTGNGELNLFFTEEGSVETRVL